MRTENPIGSIVKGGQPNWSYELLSSPMFWTRKADELHRLVELGFRASRKDTEAIRAYVQSKGLGELPHQPCTLMVSFFMASLAIENLMKAVLVREHPEYVRNGRFHGKTIISHDLKAIADDAGIQLSDDEADFCELGTECILSFGRYHMAKNLTNTPTRITVKHSAFRVYDEFFQNLKSNIRDSPFPHRAAPDGESSPTIHPASPTSQPSLGPAATSTPDTSTAKP